MEKPNCFVVCLRSSFNAFKMLKRCIKLYYFKIYDFFRNSRIPSVYVFFFQNCPNESQKEFLKMGRETSKSIPINSGVPQGGPLLPILFNIAVDFIYEEICDLQYASNNGFKLDYPASLITMQLQHMQPSEPLS